MLQQVLILNNDIIFNIHKEIFVRGEKSFSGVISKDTFALFSIQTCFTSVPLIIEIF